LGMTFEGLGEMIEGYSADTGARKFPLASMFVINSTIANSRGRPKLKLPGRNQEPTRNKVPASGFTGFEKFLSSWVSQEVQTLLLVGPRSSCFDQEVLCLAREVIGLKLELELPEWPCMVIQ
jgi:hypothetical protein